jgi:trans-aconitate methyltransferase
MTQNGKDGLCGWIRTTWLPYSERIPEPARERFISELADAYLREFPLDGAGLVHVRMVRLEIEAFKP